MWHEPLEPFIALAIPVGLLICFAGFHLLRGTAAAAGFLAAGAGAAALAQAAGLSFGLALATGVVGGLIGAALLGGVLPLSVALLGAGAGALLATATAAFRPGPPAALLVGIGAVTGGLLALLLHRAILVAATAAIGAWLAVAGVLHFTAGLDVVGEFGLWARLPGRLGYAALAGWVMLTGLGAGCQAARRSRQ